MTLKRHEERILYNIRNKPAIRELPEFIDVNICLGGEFKNVDGVDEYCGGTVYNKLCVWLNKLTVTSLRGDVEDAMRLVYNWRVASNFSIWFKVRIGEGNYVKKVLESDEDIVALINGRDMYERVNIYVQEVWDASRTRNGGLKKKAPAISSRPKVKTEPHEAQPKPLKIGSPRRRSARLDFGPDVFIMSAKEFEQTINQSSIPSPKAPSKSTTLTTCNKKQKTPPTKSNPVLSSSKTRSAPTVPQQNPPKSPPTTAQTTESCHTITRSSPRFKQVARRHVQVPVSKAKKVVTEKGKNKGKKVLTEKEKNWEEFGVTEEFEGEGQWSSDSEFSDIEVEFNPEEEDFKAKERKDEFVQLTPKDITREVVSAFTRSKTAGCSKRFEEDCQVGDGVEEAAYDSEDLHSLHGSDDEVDPYPYFNSRTDFSKKITLVTGLKFRDPYPGHYKNRCKNPPAPPKQKGKGGRPMNNDPWSTNTRLKKQARVLALQYPQPSNAPSTVTNAEASSSRAPQQPSHGASVDDQVIPSQSSCAIGPQVQQRTKPTRPRKLTVKSTTKKQT